jgi:hypothetical protein
MSLGAQCHVRCGLVLSRKGTPLQGSRKAKAAAGGEEEEEEEMR